MKLDHMGLLLKSGAILIVLTKYCLEENRSATYISLPKGCSWSFTALHPCFRSVVTEQVNNDSQYLKKLRLVNTGGQHRPAADWSLDYLLKWDAGLCDAGCWGFVGEGSMTSGLDILDLARPMGIAQNKQTHTQILLFTSANRVGPGLCDPCACLYVCLPACLSVYWIFGNVFL